MKAIILGGIIFGKVMAAGGEGGHTASPSDLLFPLCNFLLLFGYLFYKLKNPMKEMFRNNAEEVKNFALNAKQSARESEARLKEIRGKLENFSGDLSEIEKIYTKQVEDFSKDHKENLDKKLVRLNEEFVGRLERENRLINESVMGRLVDSILVGTKESIRGTHVNKATLRLLKDI